MHLDPLTIARRSFLEQSTYGLGGIALVWLILSVETYDYFVVQISRQPAMVYSPAGRGLVNELGQPLGVEFAGQADRLRRMAQTALSVVWAVYAALVLAAGFRLHSGAVRWAALVIFAVTLAKVVLVDMADLPGFYRVAALFALAVMMAVAAWAYQRLQVQHPVDEEGGNRT